MYRASLFFAFAKSPISYLYLGCAWAPEGRWSCASEDWEMNGGKSALPMTDNTVPNKAGKFPAPIYLLNLLCVLEPPLTPLSKARHHFL